MCEHWKTTKVIMRLPLFDCKHYGNRAQGFSNVALLGSKPPPQISKERVAGWARERPTGNPLFYSFFGAGRGRGKRLLRSPVIVSVLCKTGFFSEPEKPGLSYSDVVDALSQR